MQSNLLKRLFLSASVLTLFAAPAWAGDGSAADLLLDGKVFGEVRYRYESVEQAGLANDTGIASTVRGNLGFETGTWQNLKGLVEFQTLRHMADDDFNDTTNGKATYPIISDPENNEINQAWMAWSGIPKTTLKIGRQIVNLDNQRFIGSVNWRQNDQSFDAAAAIFTPIEKLSLMYGFVWNVNRIVGEHHATPDYTGDTHVLHAEYAHADWLKVAGYNYRIEVDEAAAASNNTLGVQLTGKGPISGDWKFQYLAEYARQSDYKNNTNDYSERYFHLTPTILWKNVTLQAGFESLGGEGAATRVFQTPLATLHAFNGWADKFLATPANGLEDAYLRFGYKLDGLHQWVNGTMFDTVYHDFNAEQTSADYGKEWNFQLAKTFKTEGFVTKDITVTAKYADYNTDTLFTDTEKFWLMVGTKF